MNALSWRAIREVRATGSGAVLRIEPLRHDGRMTFCPRCQGPIPKDAERPTEDTVYCPHCSALLVRHGDEWVGVESTP